jgi:murein DD-endopeptidase MepM/ murein hydrolase activator NlpD
MDDFTLPADLAAYAMHNYTPIGTPKTTQGAETADTSADFKSLMALMILSSMNLGGSGSSESGGMAGTNMSQLMAPLMLTLLEKLIADQVDNSETPTVEQQVQQAVDQSVPQGLPLKGKGHLTQGSHAGHVALDYGVPVGTSVYATMGGKVVYAGWNNEGYGNLVIVEKGEYRTYFAHLSKIPVRVGEKVDAGTVIGLSGNTGNSTGPHLHYEIRRNGTPINPTKFTKV